MSTLFLLAGFGAAGYVFGRVCRLFFRHRRWGFGRLVLANLMLTFLFVAVGAVYLGVLVDDDDGGQLDLTRPLVTFGVPVVFLMAAVAAYRRETRARVSSQKPGAPLVIGQRGPVGGPRDDAWSPPPSAGGPIRPATSPAPQPRIPVPNAQPPAGGPWLPPKT